MHLGCGREASAALTAELAARSSLLVHGLALAANAALFASRTKDAKSGEPRGLLRLVSLADGKKLAEAPLDAPPTYDGLAIAGAKAYVSLENGTVVCLGEW